MKLYNTVRERGKAILILEKSKFIANVVPVCSRDEADSFFDEIKTMYRDATHNVPALVLGERLQTRWTSDDGEPQGSAGVPVLKMLVSENITNVAIVITRYFGGVKLGRGGLVRAYTGSAKAGLTEACICSVYEICSFNVDIDYQFLPKIQYIASDKLDPEAKNQNNFVIEEIKYMQNARLTLKTMPGYEEVIIGKLNDITSGRLKVSKKELMHQSV